MEFVIWLIIGLVVGAAIGAATVWWLGRRRAGGSVEKLKRENEAFREEVNEHFVETARLINHLTDSYKAVFDHLSSGAGKLVDKKALAERMPRVSDREVRLRHLGAPEAGQTGNRSGKDDTRGSRTETGRGPGRGTGSVRPDRAGNDPLKQWPDKSGRDRGTSSAGARSGGSGSGSAESSGSGTGTRPDESKRSGG